MQGKRKDPPVDQNSPAPVVKKPYLRTRSAPPTLQSLTVTWGPADRQADAASFHVVTEAKLTSGSMSELRIVQYVRDGWSLKAGRNAPPAGKQPYYTTQFLQDANESIASNSSSVSYDDEPGFDTNFGLQAKTDLRYIFGAYWEVYLGDVLLTTTTPLYGTITGEHGIVHHRVYSPDREVEVTWDIAQGRWRNQAPLEENFPGWGAYPTPPVDNS